MKKYLGKAGVILALVLPCLLYSQESREYRDRYYIRKGHSHNDSDGTIVCYDLISNRVHTAHTGKKEPLYIYYLPTPGGGVVYAEEIGGIKEMNLYRFDLPDLRLIRKISLNLFFSDPDEALLPSITTADVIVRNPHPCLIFRAIPDANRYDGDDEYYEEVMGKGMEWDGIEVKHFIWDPIRGSDLREISYRQFKTMPRINWLSVEECRRYGLSRDQSLGSPSKNEKLKRKVRELRERYNIQTHDYHDRLGLIIEEPVPAE